MHRESYLIPNWDAPTEIKAYTTLKNGWDSTALNRESTLQTTLSLPTDPIWLNQVHQNKVVEASLQNKHAKADACYTIHPKRPCVVLTADCLPILLTNQNHRAKTKVVAAIHAGWRGLASGVIENTVKTVNRIDDHLIAWLGPAISQTHFEVGDEVYQTFVQINAQYAHAFLPGKKHKWLADLNLLAKMKLQDLGIKKVYGGDYCTFSNPDLFHSYRRDPNNPGRIATLIWIDPLSN